MLYDALFTRLLSRVPPAWAHRLGIGAVRALGADRRVRGAVRRRRTGGALSVDAFGLRFPTPLGCAAGFDKDVECVDGLGALGFGFVEVGTVTPRSQPGNPGETLLRIPSERALLNRMGFPSRGAAEAAERLGRLPGETIVGVNIGKARATALAAAHEDYRACVRAVAAHAGYLVINVSSPNTPGLRDMQATGQLREIAEAARHELRTLGLSTPLLVKISPDLADAELDAIADLALEVGLDGLVATNTTTDRTLLGPGVDQRGWFEGGGLSGPLLAPRSLGVLRRLRARTGDRVALVSVGGVQSAEDVWQRILAGATLVQAYTAFVYGGPAWPGQMNRALARRVAATGAASIGELVGSGVSPGGEAG